MIRNMLLGVLFALFMAGCSSVSVTRDYDTAMDFSTLKTFAWQYADQPQTGNPRIDNDLIDNRVRAAVNTELSQKGFEQVEKESADFLVAYYIDYKQRISGNTISFGVGTGSYGRHSAVGYDTGITDYEEGHLTIDILNPADEKNFWRGVGRRRAYETSDPEKATELVNTAVARILKKFPPK